MAVPKVKKKKPKQSMRPAKTPFDIVRTTNYLTMAVLIRELYTVYGWRQKRISDFIEGYIALMQEIADGRSTVWQTVAATKDMTGVDVVELLDQMYQAGKEFKNEKSM